jgi:hypothetical protein
MNQTVTLCDSCEKVTTRGIRLIVGNDQNRLVDLCVDCLGEVLEAYEKVSGSGLLCASITEETYGHLMADDDESEQ